MPLKTIIIEDEPLSRAFLNNLLKDFFPEITVITNEATAEEGAAAIIALKPDLVFLDIELRTGTGFGVLQQTRNVPFKVIFTTALDHLAINMIRICGVDYLQKPIDMAGLREVIEGILQRKQEHTRTALDHLMQALENNGQPLHLLLSREEHHYIPIGDIIYIEAVENLSRFMLRSGGQEKGTRSLKEYETLLSQHTFFRTHQHFLVNTTEIRQLVESPECLLIMKDNTRLPLSPKKKEALERLLDDA